MEQEEFDTDNSLRDDATGSGKVPQDKKKKRNGGDFWLGCLVGMFLMLIVSLCIIVMIYRVDRRGLAKYMGKNTHHMTTEQGEEIDLFDQDFLEKLETIESYFGLYSVYRQDKETLQNGILDGFMYGTGDKYAHYYTKEEIDALMEGYSGVFFGIGAVLQLDDNGWPTVNSVYQDSPAEKSGVRSGDIISAVNGESTHGWSLDEVVAHVRGEKDTDVTLTLQRVESQETLDVVITRGEIAEISVNYEMKEDVGYIQISDFNDTTVTQFGEALEALKQDNPVGLIIDLRANGGGLLSSVTDIARMILPEGVIVYTEDNFGRRVDYTCDGSREIDIPIVVLTNAYTASASEILTAAIKEYGKGISMGTITYGKGCVQNFAEFPDGTAMKFTSELYYTPNGTSIDGTGIEPDEEVIFDYDAYYNAEVPFDNQLQAAIDYFH